MTLVSWAISHGAADTLRPDLAVSMAVIVMSVIKARFVLHDFMEVGHASRWLRVLSDVWAVGLPVAILIALQI